MDIVMTDKQFKTILEMVDMILDGCKDLDEAKRKDLVKEYQDLLWDQMPLVPVYHGYSFSVKASRLQGYNGFESAQNNQRVWEWSVTQ